MRRQLVLPWDRIILNLNKMNFLPDENKILFKKEYFRRLEVISGCFSFFIIFFSVAMLLPKFVLLSSEKKFLQEKLESINQVVSSTISKDIDAMVAEVNREISSILGGEPNGYEKSMLIKIITNAKTVGVSLKNIDINNKQILVKGTGKMRADMLNFVDILKKESIFKKVDSPVGNLLKEKDVEFLLTISL